MWLSSFPWCLQGSPFILAIFFWLLFHPLGKCFCYLMFFKRWQHCMRHSTQLPQINPLLYVLNWPQVLSLVLFSTTSFFERRIAPLRFWAIGSFSILYQLLSFSGFPIISGPLITFSLPLRCYLFL